MFGIVISGTCLTALLIQDLNKIMQFQELTEEISLLLKSVLMLFVCKESC